MSSALAPLFERALARRGEVPTASHDGAFRLFNGFTEGCARFTIDVYARTFVLNDHAETATCADPVVDEAIAWIVVTFPWAHAIVHKVRHGATEAQRNGVLVRGESVDTRIVENGVAYAIDVTLNRDASLYLDTRAVRAWALEHLRGKRVLNTFAYTGSIGVAALAGGATQVIQVDLNKRFLEVARRSYALNRFPIRHGDFLVGDFFPTIARLNRAGERFDCVVLDPPFFSTTARGVVDLERGTTRLINKVRPLIADGGWLVVVHNALFASGAQFAAELESLCASGYLTWEARIDVPIDCVGDSAMPLVTDPAPFNHSTKIVVLRVRRKAT